MIERHWLATSPRYSTDPDDARVLSTEDEAEAYRASGWRIDGPYVAEKALREVRAELTTSHGPVTSAAWCQRAIERIDAALEQPTLEGGDPVPFDEPKP